MFLVTISLEEAGLEEPSDWSNSTYIEWFYG
jgi:hypothetical protein